MKKLVLFILGNRNIYLYLISFVHIESYLTKYNKNSLLMRGIKIESPAKPIFD